MPSVIAEQNTNWECFTIKTHRMLFSPIQFKSIQLKNRIAMSPMCQYSATDGFVNEWHLNHYTTRAVGGVGLIIVEATAVAANGRITPADLGIWDDEQLPGLTEVAQSIQSNGAVPAIQLAHAGRKASHATPWQGGQQLDATHGGWQTVGASPIAFAPTETPPQELSISEIEGIKQSFANGASRALKAGFKIIELHSAHGYLLQSFLSPLSNTRTDKYGGSFENRIRLLLETLEAMKAVWPSELPIFVRISASEWTTGGWSIEDSTKLAKILIGYGVDLIDCSSGGNIHDAKVPIEPGYQLPFAKAIKETGMPTAAVGMINTAQQANGYLQTGYCDLVLFGRELLRNPYFALHAASQLNIDNTWPIQYIRSK
jgi:2,4-dienoyl-CoA reductase-like NADH-dependent reductase (Old Yellow Enzyme family)